ncbi:Ca2+-binding RTX toxin-like protein [Roseovarius sp. MBR-79]|jgi:Ca2+-binding RTX toxin-like protein
MTTLTLTGIFVVFDDVNDTTSSVGTATFTVQFPNAGAVLNYTLLPGTEPGDLPLVDIGGTEPLSATVNGFDVLNNDDIETSLGFIQTPEGTHVLLAFFDPVQGVDAIFQIGGDPLTLPTTVAGFNALDDSITNVGVASGAFAPGVNIPITSLGGEITGGDVNPIEGTDGDDVLVGTAGDDLIITGNAAPNGDFVVGSAGNDTIDMSGNDGVDGFVTLSYDALDSGIAVTIDGAANTGTVDKGANGTDTLVDVAQPLDAGFGDGGLSVIGTTGDDSFTLAPDAGQWMPVRGGDGADSYEINGAGLVRLDFGFTGATGGAQVNLATGVIADDGFGNTETISGSSAVWEIRGTENDDLIIGSAADESFISQQGNDTIDGGGGFDRLRYDRNGVDGIDADLAAGTVTGLWNGNAFTDTISNIEWLRGSNGADVIAGDTNDNRLEGRGGIDTFVHRGGNDTISDFDADNESLVLRIAGSSFLALQAAMANATDTDAGAVVDFGGGNSITFAGLTAEQVAGITVDTGGPTEGDDTLIGTAGDDFINGLGGDDLIEGGDGADDLFGGTGNDTLIGGTGPNGLFGGAGDDSLIGGIGWEDLFGGDGNDTIVGDAGNDNIGGGAGLDLIFAGDGDDTIFGGDDNDTIWGGLGDDQIGGGNGDDQINAGGGNDEVWGGAGNDQIDGGAGNDTLSGSNGNDSIDGGDGADELWGGLGNDSLSGGEGNDTIGGFDGADFLDGGAGDDELWGGAGNDTMLGGDGADQIGGDIGADSVDGGAGNDTVFAGDGNDTVLGGDGDDLIFGGAGDDRLEGGAGNDTVWGGPGADVFVFGAGDGADVFEFFNIGAGDRIELSSDLLGGAANGAAVVSTFGSIVGGNAVLDFGGSTSITLAGLTTLDGLDTVFDIV